MRLIDVIIQVAIIVGLGYTIYNRYRSSLSVKPPPHWQIWSVRHQLSALRKAGILILALLLGIFYLLWRSELISQSTQSIIFFFALISLALISNPRYWFAEAYLYKEDPQTWGRIKKQAVAELKDDYWKILAKRFLLVLLMVILLLIFL